MKQIYKMAGIIALLCTLVLSSSAQTESKKTPFFGNATRTNVAFGMRNGPNKKVLASCVGTLDSNYAEIDSKFLFLIVKALPKIPIQSSDWDTATLLYESKIEVKDTALLKMYQGNDIYILQRSGNDLCISVQSSVVMIESILSTPQSYLYNCALCLSKEQFVFLEKIGALPSKSKNIKLISLINQ